MRDLPLVMFTYMPLIHIHTLLILTLFLTSSEMMTYSVTFEDVETSVGDDVEKHLVVHESSGTHASQLRVCEVQFFSQEAGMISSFIYCYD